MGEEGLDLAARTKVTFATTTPSGLKGGEGSQNLPVRVPPNSYKIKEPTEAGSFILVGEEGLEPSRLVVSGF